jgi:hypothetical protein
VEARVVTALAVKDDALLRRLGRLEPEGDGERVRPFEAAGHLGEVGRVVAREAERLAEPPRRKRVRRGGDAGVLRVGQVFEPVLLPQPVQRVMAGEAGNVGR